MGGCRVSVKGEGKDTRSGNESIFVPPSFQGFGYPTGSHSLDFFPQRRIPQRRKMESTWEEGELYLGWDDRQEELVQLGYKPGAGQSRAKTPPSHKLASRPVFTKKGTSAESRNPYSYSNGAEGGTRTPTGFPTTPSRWRVYQVPPLRHARKFILSTEQRKGKQGARQESKSGEQVRSTGGCFREVDGESPSIAVIPPRYPCCLQ